MQCFGAFEVMDVYFIAMLVVMHSLKKSRPLTMTIQIWQQSMPIPRFFCCCLHQGGSFHTCLLVYWLVGLSVGWLISWFMSWLVGWLVGFYKCLWLVCLLVGLLVVWSVGLLADCLACCLVCLFVRRVKITQENWWTDFDQTLMEDGSWECKVNREPI